MRNMEKAGIVIVGALIAIIVAVGLLNRPADQVNDPSKDAPDSTVRGATPAVRPVDETVVKDGPRREDPPVIETPKKVDNSSPSDGNRLAGTGDSTKVAGGVTPATEPLADGWPKEYTVKAGDHFTKIATREYGDVSMAAMIAKANPDVDPTKLQAGKTVLTLPRPQHIAAPNTVVEFAANVVGGPVGAAADVSRVVSSPGTDVKKTVAPAGTTPKRPAFITASYLKANLASLSSQAKVRGGKTYRTKAGDTLNGIALKQLGSARHADAIRRANASVIKDPKKLPQNVVLNLPAIN